MKQNNFKRILYMIIMLILLIMSLITTDVFISHLYAFISIIIGALASHQPSDQNKISYE